MSPEIRISPPLLWADFNYRDDAGHLRAMIPGGGTIAFLSEGMQVRLSDEDGNYCDGIVETLDGARALISPIWSTWTTETRIDDYPGEYVTGTYPEPAAAVG
jgi:hypothetical protein